MWVCVYVVVVSVSVGTHTGPAALQCFCYLCSSPVNPRINNWSHSFMIASHWPRSVTQHHVSACLHTYRHTHTYIFVQSCVGDHKITHKNTQLVPMYHHAFVFGLIYVATCFSHTIRWISFSCLCIYYFWFPWVFFHQQSYSTLHLDAVSRTKTSSANLLPQHLQRHLHTNVRETAPDSLSTHTLFSGRLEMCAACKFYNIYIKVFLSLSPVQSIESEATWQVLCFLYSSD